MPLDTVLFHQRITHLLCGLVFKKGVLNVQGSTFNISKICKMASMKSAWSSRNASVQNVNLNCGLINNTQMGKKHKKRARQHKSSRHNVAVLCVCSTSSSNEKKRLPMPKQEGMHKPKSESAQKLFHLKRTGSKQKKHNSTLKIFRGNNKR